MLHFVCVYIYIYITNIIKKIEIIKRIQAFLTNGQCYKCVCVCVCACACVCYLIIVENAWKWHDIRPSMVTHTQNLCSAFNPSKVHTHSSEHTHTHTRSSGQPFMQRLGNSWGFGGLLKSTSVVVLRVERALYIHSPHLQFLPDRDSNSQPFDWLSTIRPRLPQICVL